MALLTSMYRRRRRRLLISPQHNTNTITIILFTRSRVAHCCRRLQIAGVCLFAALWEISKKKKNVWAISETKNPQRRDDGLERGHRIFGGNARCRPFPPTVPPTSTHRLSTRFARATGWSNSSPAAAADDVNYYPFVVLRLAYFPTRFDQPFRFE